MTSWCSSSRAKATLASFISRKTLTSPTKCTSKCVFIWSDCQKVQSGNFSRFWCRTWRPAGKAQTQWNMAPIRTEWSKSKTRKPAIKYTWSRRQCTNATHGPKKLRPLAVRSKKSITWLNKTRGKPVSMEKMRDKPRAMCFYGFMLLCCFCLFRTAFGAFVRSHSRADSKGETFSVTR